MEPWREFVANSFGAPGEGQKVVVARLRATFSKIEALGMFPVGVSMQCTAPVASYMRFQKIVEILV